MTPAQLARLHRAAFTTDRPWGAPEFEALLQAPHTALISRDGGFALIRTLAGESELLTLAVDPARRRQGIGRQLCADWLARAAPEAETAFLEVAADNLPALALYQGLGFAESGLRKGYYARPDGRPADAVLMRRCLTLGQHRD